MPQDCVICAHAGGEVRRTTNLLGIITANPAIAMRCEKVARADGAPHLMAPVCPEHVVEIYRGRVDGVAMAWRTGTTSLARTISLR